MIKITLGILILFYLKPATGQILRTSSSVIIPGLGTGAEVFAFTTNQAAIPDSAGVYIGVHSRQKFGIEGLEAHQVAVLIPLQAAYVGISGTFAGSMHYSEGGLSLGYGLNLGSRVSVGVQFNRLILRARGYEAVSSVNIEGGVRLRIAPQLHFGLHLYNPTGSKWNKREEEQLPRVFTVLLVYEVSAKVLLHTAMRKTERAAAEVECALRYAFAPRMIARAGIASSTRIFFLGSGLQLRACWILLSVSRHPQLGFTPGLTLTYHFPRK